MSKSKIEWTDRTWNVSTGCTKVSDGCKNCYAERIFPRVYGNDKIDISTKEYLNGKAKKLERLIYRPRKFTDIKLHHDRLEQPLHWKKPSMIFVNSMSDLFHEDVTFKFIDNVIHIIAHCEQHTFQVLTKRPESMHRYFHNFRYPYLQKDYPFHNLWLGVSVENQKTIERIYQLFEIPAKVRWVSFEPLLEDIGDIPVHPDYKNGLDWAVVGAESGPKRRHCDLNWVGSMVDQCKRANVPVFVKQLHIDGKLVKDINKFPKHLQIREYPNGNNN